MPRGASAGRALGRQDRSCRWRRGRRRAGAVARAHEPDRGDRQARRHHDRGSRMCAANGLRSGRCQWAVLPARSRCARLSHDRRQHLDQRRWQPGHPLWHDARHGARPGGGVGRRHRPVLAQPPDQEQRRIRPEAALHRLRGHAGRCHARSAALATAAGQPEHCFRGRRRVRSAARLSASHGADARGHALSLRGHVGGFLQARHDAAGERTAAVTPRPALLRAG